VHISVFPFMAKSTSARLDSLVGRLLVLGKEPLTGNGVRDTQGNNAHSHSQ
jgi:hypothetical protein